MKILLNEDLSTIVNRSRNEKFVWSQLNLIIILFKKMYKVTFQLYNCLTLREAIIRFNQIFTWSKLIKKKTNNNGRNLQNF